MELLHDLDMVNIIEKMKRGGHCFVGRKRYAKNKVKHHMPDSDPNKPSNYFIYAAANNLYGCSMSLYLPHKDLNSKNDIELATILNTPDDAETGSIVEVDLDFLVELHDKLK